MSPTPVYPKNWIETAFPGGQPTTESPTMAQTWDALGPEHTRQAIQQLLQSVQQDIQNGPAEHPCVCAAPNYHNWVIRNGASYPQQMVAIQINCTLCDALWWYDLTPAQGVVPTPSTSVSQESKQSVQVQEAALSSSFDSEEMEILQRYALGYKLDSEEFRMLARAGVRALKQMGYIKLSEG